MPVRPLRRIEPGRKQPLRVSLRRAEIRLHPQLAPTELWTYEGRFPGPVFEVRSGQSVAIEWANEIDGPVPVTAVRAPDNTQNEAGASSGVPLPGVEALPAFSVTHLHGGRTEANSDGWPENVAAPGQSSLFTYGNAQRAALLWYHDHAMGVTRFNVYAGLAGLWIIRDEEEESLSLPGGKHELPLLLQDRNLGTAEDGTLTGRLLHKVEDGVMEFFGPLTLVNGMIWPHLPVTPRQYRLRIVNGSNARVFRLLLLDQSRQPIPDAWLQIGGDGGLFAEPVQVPASGLVLAPAERADLIVDFRAFRGHSLTLVNTAGAPFDNSPAQAAPGEPDPANKLPFPEVMQFRVSPKRLNDLFTLPGKLSSLEPIAHAQLPHHDHRLIALVEQAMPGSPTPLLTLREMQALQPEEVGAPDEPLIAITDSTGATTRYRTLASEFRDRINYTVTQNSTEVWKIINLTGDTHPFHIHLAQFQLLGRQLYNIDGFNADTGATTEPITFDKPGSIDANEGGWKDTARVNPNEMLLLAAVFEGFSGRYMYHCHILEHEDHEMMRPFIVLPAPLRAAMSDTEHGSHH